MNYPLGQVNLLGRRPTEKRKQALPIADPGPDGYDFEYEAVVRKMIEDHAAYAEDGKTFDPQGTYLCGDCNMRVEPNACTVVGQVRISMDHGGCRRWEGGAPMGEPLPKKSEPWLVGYGERPKGFGCSRCEYDAEAKAPDEDGRPDWCGFWGLHVIPLACCEENNGPDLKEPYLVRIGTES